MTSISPLMLTRITIRANVPLKDLPPGEFVEITWECPSATMRCNRMPDEGGHETNCGQELPVGCGDGDESDEDMTDDGSEAPLSEPPTFDKLRLVDPEDEPAWEPGREPQQVLFADPNLGGFPPICTKYHEKLDEEQYNTKIEWRVPLPNVTTLHIDDVHPKLLYAFLTHFTLPEVNSLNLMYDIRGQPERRELLLVLLNVGKSLLWQLIRFHSIRELHCHHIDVLERFYVAIQFVKEFTLHYWDGPSTARSGSSCCRRNLSHLITHGLAAAKLITLLDNRNLVGEPIWGVCYSEGYILQHERDKLERESASIVSWALRVSLSLLNGVQGGLLMSW
ncbi:uncharacterized protein B0H18DRAFT_950635 [Fomitopsis serialis]|uniref:uncharacterized protein n=1 Tax=Fomitopsis serialis TaxID=139415 RepID=UPI0020084B21|nr:uncharacterized protein B0H18DRAFT_950635 [Neoantrodia serialis]KAH9936293.1 hypothetical protein B0H18DRAFT_950635 [Neoantrodia serialis]